VELALLKITKGSDERQYFIKGKAKPDKVIVRRIKGSRDNKTISLARY
jgi:hypothetical protein